MKNICLILFLSTVFMSSCKDELKKENDYSEIADCIYEKSSGAKQIFDSIDSILIQYNGDKKLTGTDYVNYYYAINKRDVVINPYLMWPRDRSPKELLYLHQIMNCISDHKSDLSKEKYYIYNNFFEVNGRYLKGDHQDNLIEKLAKGVETNKVDRLLYFYQLWHSIDYNYRRGFFDKQDSILKNI